MKITIAPTNNDNHNKGRSADCVNHAVTIEHPYDDLNAVEAIRLMAHALIAYGFHPKSVADCLDKELGREVYMCDCTDDTFEEEC